MDVRATELATSNIYRIGDLIVDADGVRVLRAGEQIALPKLSFALLIALIEIAPSVGTTEYLLARVWPGLIVSLETVTKRVELLRAALGEDPKQPHYISLVRGRGYRLIPVVERYAENIALQIRNVPDPATEFKPTVQESVQPRRFGRSAIVWLICAIGLTAILLMIVGQGLWGRRISQSRSVSLPSASAPIQALPARTVAVLAFESVGPHAKEDEVLASGFSESVMRALSGTEQIMVIARRSSFAFKGQNIDAREIGRRLNARYLLEGSLQRANEQMRIQAYLVDAETGQNTWSVTFDKPVADLFVIEDEIAQKVAKALTVTLNAGPDERRHTPKYADFDAYVEYLTARELAVTYRLSNLEGAADHYSHAMALDPEFSSAYSGLADVKLKMLDLRPTDSSERDRLATQAEARLLLEKALALDPHNADAWQTLATAENDPARSEIYERRAVALEPSLARAQFGLSEALSRQGFHSPERIDEVLGLMNKAMQLDPLEPRYPTAIAFEYIFHRTTLIDQAEPLLMHALELDPNYFPALYNLASLQFCCQGRFAEAIKTGEQALQLEPTSTSVRGLLAQTYLGVNDLHAAEQVLSKDNTNSTAWMAVYAYRHEWRKAAAIMYDDHTRANLPTGADGITGTFVVAMDSQNKESFVKARTVLEKLARVTWKPDGTPVTDVPVNRNLFPVIALADLYERTGEPMRARRLLELTLALMDTAAGEYKRGELWFALPRSRALALLGRREEAFSTLEQIPQSGLASFWWQILVDPAYDGMRSDPRFRDLVAERREHAARERAQLDAMRAQNVVPTRPP
jgi:TolB-like protein/DNA-binding winged helix-turn-helix (wHTH) protein/cytochrome c-type biogenesis protein CcmH/NrfG